MIGREEALEHHAGHRPGKIEVTPSVPCLVPRELRLAYLPGAVFPGQEIAADVAASYRYTARGNLVGVVTNGTAVPGLGAVGPAAAKPMQEGIVLLLKRLADLDAFDLELETGDPDRFVEAVRMLEPTFGAINLKDIRHPEGIAIYERLREAMGIPVLHENLHGPAVVAVAGLLNALDLVGKPIDGVRIVALGAGTVGLGCLRLLSALGVSDDQIALYDRQGLVRPDRGDLSPFQLRFARRTAAESVAEAVRGADVLIGASAPGAITTDMIQAMGRNPVVMALASPEPEIAYADAHATRRDVVVFTSRWRDPNGASALLSFPFVLRGALDVRARRISDRMMLAAARALAELAREEVVEEVSRVYGRERFSFGPEYLLPKPVDPRTLVWASTAVAREAVAEGLADMPRELDEYREHLTLRLGPGRELMRRLIVRARRVTPRLVLPDGTAEQVLRACPLLVDEGIANPILLGGEEEVRSRAERFGVDLRGVAIVDPCHDPRLEGYVETYFQMRARRGATRDLAAARVRLPMVFAALMLHHGDVDVMVGGVTTHYADSVRAVLEVVGPAPGVGRISSQYLVLRTREVYVLADCAVNIEPSQEELAEIALLAARLAETLGFEPRVAMLSFSNYGSVDHPLTRKVRAATAIARERRPELEIDGELQLLTALDADLRQRYFPFATLSRNANVLVFPDLQSGNLAMHLLGKLGDATLVGPILAGTRLPVHVLQYGSTVRDVVDLAAVAAVCRAAAAPDADG